MASKRNKKKWARRERDLAERRAHDKALRNTADVVFDQGAHSPKTPPPPPIPRRPSYRPLSDAERDELAGLRGLWGDRFVAAPLDSDRLKSAQRLADLLRRSDRSDEAFAANFISSCESARSTLRFMSDLRSNLQTAPVSYDRIMGDLLNQSDIAPGSMPELVEAVQSDLTAFGRLGQRRSPGQASSPWHCYSLEGDRELATLARGLQEALTDFLAEWQKLPGDAPEKLAIPPAIRLGLAQICEQVSTEMRQGLVVRSTMELLRRSIGKVMIVLAIPVAVGVAVEGLNKALFDDGKPPIIIRERAYTLSSMVSELYERIDELHGSSLVRETRFDFGIDRDAD